MNKLLLAVGLAFVLSVSLVSAHGHDVAGAKQLIDSGVGCSQLSEEQLEAIGDYYMEQMHPGEAHELMDVMMGGEGSESLRDMHVRMARALYCGEGAMDSGMMGSGGMMGMMNMMGSGSTMGSGMMGPGTMGASYRGYWNLFNVLYAILLVGLIILTYLGIITLWKMLGKRRKLW